MPTPQTTSSPHPEIRSSLEPALILGTDSSGQPVVLNGRLVRTHKHIWGLSGYGKSMLLLSLYVQLLNHGQACAVIDPHGDLVRDILRVLIRTGYFRDERAYERLLYVDFGREDRFPAFNVLDQPYADHQVARDLLTAFKRAWASLEDGSAPMLENIVLAAALVLIQNNRLPLTAMPQLLLDAAFRERLLAQVSDPQVVRFFRARFDRLGKGAGASVESTLRRVFMLTYAPALRYALGNPRNGLRLRAQMDRGVSVLYNLSGLDEDSQRLLGALLMVGYERAALSRADIPAGQRRPYHLLVDEFSQFSAQSEESLARVLDLTRKFGLHLVLSHQTGSQLRGRIAGALQNAIEIAFRLGHEDALRAAPRLVQHDPTALKPDPLGLHSRPAYASPQEQVAQLAATLERLPPREACIRIGRETRRIRTLSVPLDPESADLARVIERYAQRLLVAREQIDEWWLLPGSEGARQLAGQNGLVQGVEDERERATARAAAARSGRQRRELLPDGVE